MSCATACAVVIPTYPSGGCDIVTRPGGIKKIFVTACDYIFTDINDLDEWADAIVANKIHASGEVLGSKPKGSLTKKKIVSCRPDIVTGGTRSIDFIDPNADNVAFGEYDFWNFVQNNQSRLLFGYTTCDDLVYGFIPSTGTTGEFTPFSIELDDTRTGSNDDNAQIEGSFSWNSRVMSKPIKIAGINGILG